MKNLSSIFIVAIAFLSSASGESAYHYTKDYTAANSNRHSVWNDTRNVSNSKYTSTSENSPSSDEHIAKKIRWLIHHDASLSNESKTVQVNVTGGKVRLSGTVNNTDDKTKIETIAKQVNGVSNVSNDLTISNK